MNDDDFLVQCQLSSGNSRLVCNLPMDSRLKVGVKVTLKDSEDPDQYWTVDHIGQPVRKHSIKRLWNNNI